MRLFQHFIASLRPGTRVYYISYSAMITAQLTILSYLLIYLPCIQIVAIRKTSAICTQFKTL